MKKWNLIVDLAKCFNCNNCALAVHDEYHGNEHPGVAAEMPRQGHRWIDVLQRERGVYPMIDVVSMPVTCNHCDDPPCLKAARDGAVTKRADGIVVIVPEKAKGQRQIMEACPYGAVWWNDEKNLPQAWPFDAHLLDSGWTKTRASQVCPTEAIRTLRLEDDEMLRMVAEEGLEVLHPEYGTKPRVYYKNLDRWRKAFVGGSLAGVIDGVVECLSDIRVELSKDGRTVGTATTDTFGDFRIDGLPEGSGRYRVEIFDPRFGSKEIEVDLGTSVYLGAIMLSGPEARP
ncbi:MAG: oxidoreductase [Rhodospirillales bacterium]|nr:oxidoreductase [Rhodospirillales bacterium]